MTASARGQIDLVEPVMNRTEARYADVLEARRRAGEIAIWKFGVIAFRLAERKCFYHPDFFVMLADGTVEIHEVKGDYVREDAWVKLKIAASHFPFIFRKCTWTKDKRWVIELVGAGARTERVEKPRTNDRRTCVPQRERPERYRGGKIPAGYAVVNGELVTRASALSLLKK